MATKLYDLIVAVSTYKDSNGNDKKRWENVGAIWQDTDSNGNTYSYIMMKRYFNPAGVNVREGSDAIRISLVKPQPKQQQQPQQQAQSYNNSQVPDFGQPIEEIPF